MIEDNLLTKSKFTKLIEATVIETKLSYMDTILHLCERNEIDPEDVRKFISPIIKEKLEAEAEAMALNFLPKTNSLDSAFFE